MDDSVEKHREMTYEILDKLYEKLKGNEKSLDRDLIINLIKSIASRVSGTPFLEKSEHIRLIVVEHLRKLLAIYPFEFLPILSDISVSVEKALLD